MNERIYVHAIGKSSWYDSDEQLMALDTICKSGSLLSLKNQKKVSKGNFSGLDYISLCDFEKRFEYNKQNYSKPNSVFEAFCMMQKVLRNYNAYNHYVKRALSLSFPKESIDAIRPQLVNICSRNARGYSMMQKYGESNDERYSDYPDEVQVKDSLSLDKMNAILFPTEEYVDSLFLVNKRTKIESLLYEIKYIKQILKSYDYNVSIYDNSTLDEIDDEYIDRFVLTHK